MKKHLELMKRVDLIKSITLQEIESYLIEGSCKVTQYGKNNIVHFVGDVCSKFSPVKWLLSALTSPAIS